MKRNALARPVMTTLDDRTVPAVVAGSVYADVDGNGSRDAGEPGLGGVTVFLSSGATGAVSQTATTDGNGVYKFGNVPEAQNSVTVLPSGGTSPVGPTTQLFTVAPAAQTATAPAIGLQPSGHAGGTVFTDLNGNGKQDAGEPGYAGANVSLDLFADGTAEYTMTSTDAGGAFDFAHLPDGVHRLTVATPTNSKLTTVATSLISVANGNASTGPLRVGVQPTSAVSGRLTLGGAAGDVGLANVAVGLDTTGDGTADMTATTDADGRYVFRNAPAGNQSVLITAPAGTRFSTPTGTGTLPVTVAAPTATSAALATAPDVAVTYAGSVVGSLFADANNNGVRDAGERAVSPGSVQVDLNGTGQLVTFRAIAQADGSFRVEGLPDGTHYVTVTPGGGATTTSTTRVQVNVGNGSTATLPPLNVRVGGVGTGLTLGGGSAPGARTYNFTRDPGGALTATAGATTTPPTSGRAGNRVVTADINGDGAEDTIVATAGGEVAMIYAYDGRTGAELIPGGMLAFDAGFKGGVNLAAADFNNDGKVDIVAAADVGGGPRVRIFDSAQMFAGADAARGKVLTDFFAIDDPKFRGGARVAAGDLNGDSTPDLVVSAGAGGGPRVAIFDGQSLMPGNAPKKLIGDFFAYESSLRNGATVSVGDVNGDGMADLVTGAGPGGAPRVTVFSGPDVLANRGANSTRVADFFVANNTGGRTGTNITVKDVDRDGKADLVATNGGKAYVYTSTTISANYLTPNPAGPNPDAVLDGFNDGSAISVG
jgi:hypothetical protein